METTPSPPAESLAELVGRLDALNDEQAKATLKNIVEHIWKASSLLSSSEMMEGIMDALTEAGLSCENHRPFEDDEG